MRILIYEDEDFKFEYSLKAGEIFLHCTVFNWSLSSLKKGREVFKEFKQKKEELGIPALYSVSPNPKFCRLLGGEFIGKVNENNKEYEVFRWVLKP